MLRTGPKLLTHIFEVMEASLSLLNDRCSDGSPSKPKKIPKLKGKSKSVTEAAAGCSSPDASGAVSDERIDAAILSVKRCVELFEAYLTRCVVAVVAVVAVLLPRHMQCGFC